MKFKKSSIVINLSKKKCLEFNYYTQRNNTKKNPLNLHKFIKNLLTKKNKKTAGNNRIHFHHHV